MTVELYQFERGSSTWYYTNSLDSYLFDGNTYNPEIISYGRVNITTEVFKASLNLSISITADVVSSIVDDYDVGFFTLRIWRDESLWWAGRVVGCTIKEDSAVLKCESIYSSIKRLGVTTCYNKLCRHNIYSTDCGVDRDSFKVAAAEVTVVSGRDITIPGVAGDDDRFKMGLLYLSPKYTTIIKRVSDVFTVSQQIDIVVGSYVDLFWGCNRQISDCYNKFNNVVHFGGFPWVPSSNIFEVGIV